MHLAKHFSLVLFISSCALAKAISERTLFITASFFAVMSDGELDNDDLKKSDMLQTRGQWYSLESSLQQLG